MLLSKKKFIKCKHNMWCGQLCLIRKFANGLRYFQHKVNLTLYKTPQLAMLGFECFCNILLYN